MSRISTAFPKIYEYRVIPRENEDGWHQGSETGQICIFCDLRYNFKKKTLLEHIFKMYFKNPRAIQKGPIYKICCKKYKIRSKP
jgi:hypothetical protein